MRSGNVLVELTELVEKAKVRYMKTYKLIIYTNIEKDKKDL
jgi:hypothetical protein